MKSYTRLILCLLALVLAVGCASTKVSEQHTEMGAKEKIAKPERIYVFPFAATHDDIPSWSVAAKKYIPSSEPPDPEHLKVGREMGALVATKVVTEIQLMGLSALEGNSQTIPRTNDILIIGYFEAVEEGSTIKRLALGFGAGAAGLQTAVEGYQTTPKGPRLLGSAKLDSAGGKGPGLVVPLAVTAATANPIGLVVMGTVKATGELTGNSGLEGEAKRTAEEIATQLRIKFKEQGWIK